jgi:hypothetical protein
VALTGIVIKQSLLEMASGVVLYQISLGICEEAAESGVLSNAPQTREPRRFKLVLASCGKLGRFLGPPQRRLFPTISPPPNTQKNPLTRGPILAPRPLTPEMDFSRSLTGHGSQYIWDFVPIYPSPSLPYSSSLSKLGCLLSFQPNPGIQS